MILLLQLLLVQYATANNNNNNHIAIVLSKQTLTFYSIAYRQPTNYLAVLSCKLPLGHSTAIFRLHDRTAK